MCSDIEDDYMECDEGPDAMGSDLAEAIRLAQAFDLDEVCDDDQGCYTDTEALGIATPTPRPVPVLPLRFTRKSKSSSSSSPPQAELSDSSPNQRRRLSSKQTASHFVVKKRPDASELFPADIDGAPHRQSPIV